MLGNILLLGISALLLVTRTAIAFGARGSFGKATAFCVSLSHPYEFETKAIDPVELFSQIKEKGNRTGRTKHERSPSHGSQIRRLF